MMVTNWGFFAKFCKILTKNTDSIGWRHCNYMLMAKLPCLVEQNLFPPALLFPGHLHLHWLHQFLFEHSHDLLDSDIPE